MSPQRQQPRPDKALLNRIASMAADQAVVKIFTTLGIDITTPSAVIEAQELFMSLRNLKRDWAVFRNRLIMTGATLFASGLGAWFFGLLKAPQPPL